MVVMAWVEAQFAPNFGLAVVEVMQHVRLAEDVDDFPKKALYLRVVLYEENLLEKTEVLVNRNLFRRPFLSRIRLWLQQELVSVGEASGHDVVVLEAGQHLCLNLFLRVNGIVEEPPHAFVV